MIQFLCITTDHGNRKTFYKYKLLKLYKSVLIDDYMYMFKLSLILQLAVIK